MTARTNLMLMVLILISILLPQIGKPMDPRTFTGKAPFSEPESVVIKQVVEQFTQPNDLYHSQSALVSPEASSASETWAHWYANKTGYKYFTDWDFPGTATKWFLETTGNPAITVELTWNLQSDWEINQSALLELISSDKNLI